MSSQRRVIDYSDPRNISVQVAIRIPYWYREQLDTEARRLGVSIGKLLLDALQRAYQPNPPAKAR